MGIKDRSISFDSINFEDNERYACRRRGVQEKNTDVIEFATAKKKINIDTLLSLKNNLCILGPAGCGKSYFINKIYENTDPETVLMLAPTGKAAENLKKGSTIHAGLKIDVKSLYHHNDKGDYKKLKKINMLIIDEVGMVRADLFEVIINTLSQAERQYNKKIQFIILGDFMQLEPVLPGKLRKEFFEIWNNVDTTYSFSAPSFRACEFTYISFEGIYKRCDDAEFNQQLEKIRKYDVSSMDYYQKFLFPFLDYDENATHLCGTNEQADEINTEIIKKMKRNKL